MERVAFLVEETGERIDCLLNPETFEVTRLAGIGVRGSGTGGGTGSGKVIGTGLADDPLWFTGGGRTTISLDLLFDVDFVEAKARPSDVRALTRRLWMLAENSAEEHGAVRPPLVRLVWCKTWNVLGVIVAVGERFDAFDAFGTPSRSWLRIKLVRAAESMRQAESTFENELATAQQTAAARAATEEVPSALGAAGAELPHGAVQAIGDGRSEPGFSGVRFDLLANDGLGNPFLWRLLARYNDIANPLDVPPGTVLGVPPGTPGSMATARGRQP